MDIYEAILQGLKRGLPAHQGIESYLQSLQKSVRSLRIAYRSNIPIYVPYEMIDIQAAYLATYLPHYYQLIYKIFIEDVPNIFGNENEINLTFIGGGPGSEAYGAIKYIINNCNQVKIIRVLILDINASTWNYSHSIVSDNIIESINHNKVEIYWNSIAFDLTSEDDVSKIKHEIVKSNLLVIQNCLNEIAINNLPKLNNNIKLLFEYLPNHAYLLMIDMTSAVRQILKNLECNLVESFAPKLVKSTLSSPNSRSLISVHHRPSPIISQNLLVGSDGLIPRKYIGYDYSVLSKGISEEPVHYDELGFAAIYRPLDFKNLDANDYIHSKIFIGIDFGTSTTIVSIAQLVNRKIRITPIPIKQKNHLGSETRKTLVPSVISLVDDKKLLVGVYAADHKPYLVYGKNTWYSFKQNLVNIEEVRYNDSVLAMHPKYKISNAAEALTLYFSYLKREIFEFLNEHNLPTDVEYSIGIPAAFTSKEKQSLKSCLVNSGISCEDAPFIEEPNAALINYLYEKNIFIEINEPKNILVLDLGAGTVDVSILHAEKNDGSFSSKLLSVVRLGNIGGNLIDTLMADFIIQKYSIVNSIDELHKIELVNLCEQLKIIICKAVIVDKATNFELPILGISNDTRSIPPTSNLISKGVNSISFSFSDFSSLMKSYWLGASNNAGIQETIDKAVINANLDLSRIDKVIITGGGGRNPYIKNQVANYFKNSELFISDNIQEQVSRGVALHSFVLNSFGKNIITPILAHDICLKGRNNSVTLFENGTHIPSMDIEVFIEESLGDEELLVECYSQENSSYHKFFTLPKNNSISKLIFYVAPDQELRCEVVGVNYESEAIESLIKPICNLIKIK